MVALDWGGALRPAGHLPCPSPPSVSSYQMPLGPGRVSGGGSSRTKTALERLSNPVQPLVSSFGARVCL